MKKYLLAFTAAVLASGSLMAEDIILDVSTATDIQGVLNEGSTICYQPVESLEIGSFKFSFEAGANVTKSQNPALYHTNAIPTIRLYLGSVMTISFPDGSSVGSITWTCTNIKGIDSNILCSSGEISTQTADKSVIWNNTGNAGEVTFTLPSIKGSDGVNPNVQISKFTVSAEGIEINPDPIDPDPIDPDPIDPTPGDALYTGLMNECDWTFDDVNLPEGLNYVWKWDDRYSYLKGSAYYKGIYVAESWAVSPVIDLTKAVDPSVNFEHAASYQTTLRELCGFYVREENGEWQELAIANWPEAGSWTFVEAGAMSLKAFAGKKIQLAAKYESSEAGADTWEIKNVVINGTIGETPIDPDPIDPDPIDPTPGNDLYTGLAEDCDWTFDNINLPEDLSYVWKWDDRYNYLKGSAYYKGIFVAESWAVSPVIDLTKAVDPSVNFEHAASYQTTLRDLCGFYVREENGEWQELAIANWPEAGSWTFVEAGAMSLKAFAGKKIQLAAKYESSEAGADTWEIKNVVVSGTIGETPIDPDPVEDGILEVQKASDIIGEFNETQYKEDGSVQIYARYQPLDSMEIEGYEFTFDASEESANGAALYMTADGLTPQTLRMYRGNEMTIAFPAGAKVGSLVWNFKSIKGLDYVTVSSGEAQVKAHDKVLLWNNTDGAASVTFTLPSEKGSDGNNPNVQIISFAVSAEGLEIDPDPIDPDPVPGEAVYTGLADNCDWTFEYPFLPEEIEYVWSWDGAYNYLKGTAYHGQAYPAEAWAISPVINLSNSANPSVNFSHAAKFQTTLRDLCGFYVREENGEWQELKIANWPAAGSWTFVEAGAMSLQEYTGKKIQLGFKYGSSENAADTWEIRNVVVSDTKTGIVSIPGEENEAVYYDLNGRRVARPSNGIFIKVSGNKVTKAVIR